MSSDNFKTNRNKGKHKRKFKEKNQADGANENENGDIFTIEKSEIFGRYLVANRNIAPGEIVIENDEPIVVGPTQQSKPLCLGCYAIIKNINKHRCSKCNWPICNASCAGLYNGNGHSSEECEILSNTPFEEEIKRDMENMYNFIVPLRCLLLKKTALSKWELLINMESHNKIRENIKNIWELNEKTVVNKIGKYFDPREIHTVCGVLEVNCFEVTINDVSLRALFSMAFLMAHNCVPNTVHTNDSAFKLRVRSSVEIPKGQPITISYAYTLQGTAKRRAHIKETKFFDCTCNRCIDPTELGTNSSTITCPKCNHPTLVSSEPLNYNAQWTCKYKKCSNISVSQTYVNNLIEKFENELQEISENDIERYESWLKKASLNLHENHYLLLGVKYTLCLLYGKIPGYMIQDMNEDLLKRKIIVCEELLKIANIIEPGLSRLRGIVLYELHAPIMMSISQKSKSQSITKKQLKHSLQKVLLYLKEACDIFQFESETTSEGKIGLAAKQALHSTSQWEKHLGKLC